jgi:hypothetical protein
LWVPVAMQQSRMMLFAYILFFQQLTSQRLQQMFYMAQLSNKDCFISIVNLLWT